jgi:hypothetical protein
MYRYIHASKGLKQRIPVFVQAKTFHALDSVATVIAGNFNLQKLHYSSTFHSPRKYYFIMVNFYLISYIKEMTLKRNYILSDAETAKTLPPRTHGEVKQLSVLIGSVALLSPGSTSLFILQ